jgi:hypothetical protein
MPSPVPVPVDTKAANAAASAVWWSALIMTVFVVLHVGVAAVMSFWSTYVPGALSFYLVTYGGVFGLPAILLFALAPGVRRGSIAALGVTIGVGLCPTVVLVLAIVAFRNLNIAPALLCPFAASAPMLYAVARCVDVLSRWMETKRRLGKVGFPPIMIADPAQTGEIAPRPTQAGQGADSVDRG